MVGMWVYVKSTVSRDWVETRAELLKSSYPLWGGVYHKRLGTGWYLTVYRGGSHDLKICFRKKSALTSLCKMDKNWILDELVPIILSRS